MTEVAEALRWSIFTSWNLSLCGNPTERQKKYYERSSKPQPGDWVTETTNQRAPAYQAVGKLIAKIDETVQTEDEEGKIFTYTEPCWWIETIGNQVFVWWNAEMVALPPRQPQPPDYSLLEKWKEEMNRVRKEEGMIIPA